MNKETETLLRAAASKAADEWLTSNTGPSLSEIIVSAVGTILDSAESERNEILEVVRRIGKVVGCGHTENPEDRERIVHCVRDSVSKVNEAKALDLESEKLCKDLCWKLGNALHRVEVAEAIVGQLPTTADGVPIVPEMHIHPLHPLPDEDLEEEGFEDYAIVRMVAFDPQTGEPVDYEDFSKNYSTKQAAAKATGDDWRKVAEPLARRILPKTPVKFPRPIMAGNKDEVARNIHETYNFLAQKATAFLNQFDEGKEKPKGDEK